MTYIHPDDTYKTEISYELQPNNVCIKCWEESPGTMLNAL